MFASLRRSPFFPFVVLAALAVVIGVVLVVLVSRDRRGNASVVTAINTQVPVQEEQCLVCHGGMTGFSAFHRPETIGCVRCHGGNPADSTEAGGHEGMIVVPGNLGVADQTCGGVGCHPDQVARVAVSLMATGRGIVAVDRFVFGEQPTPNGTDGFDALGDSHADTHLRQLCSTCHLGHPKTAPGPITELSRGGGCVACHLQYAATEDTTVHPALTIDATNDHCFGCHSRSGRISTNYQGWHETTLTAADVSLVDSTYRLLEDGRVFSKQPEDVHHAGGMACIDCHTARETMGDGTLYAHQDEQIEVACASCHLSEPPQILGWDELDPESQKIVLIRFGEALPARRFLKTSRGNALINVFIDPGEAAPVLEGKLNGRRYALAPPADECTRAGHERLSCQSCHSAWVPQCIGCHTQRDQEGQWLEFISDFLAEPPTLGVREDTTAGYSRIEPFAPGMIMTLNTHRRRASEEMDELAAEGTFHRLFAPAVPHTVSAEGRSCQSCHNTALALGIGRGVLALQADTSAYWTFVPDYAALRDGLPADAWTRFLGASIDPSATRLDARPFNRREQQRILRVGACLTCHEPDAENKRRIYNRFDEALREVTTACKVTAVGTYRHTSP